MLFAGQGLEFLLRLLQGGFKRLKPKIRTAAVVMYSQRVIGTTRAKQTGQNEGRSRR